MKQIASFSMILVAVLFTCCVEEMTADQIAARMEAKQESIKDYDSVTGWITA